MRWTLFALGAIALGIPSTPADAQSAGSAPTGASAESARPGVVPAGDAAPAAPAAEPATELMLGFYLERNYSTQPGVQVTFGGWRLWGGRPRLTLGYSTTRMEISRGAKALKEDRVQGGAAWQFRPGATLGTFAGLTLGYTRFDREDDDLFALLDNGGPIASLLVGLEARVISGTRVSGSVGYSALQSSTVYPFVASIGIHREIRGGTR